MCTCDFVKECSYINGTIKHKGNFNDIFKNNFCKYYYKNCAVWEIANRVGVENVPKNLLPFQHNPEFYERI